MKIKCAIIELIDFGDAAQILFHASYEKTETLKLAKLTCPKVVGDFKVILNFTDVDNDDIIYRSKQTRYWHTSFTIQTSYGSRMYY